MIESITPALHAPFWMFLTIAIGCVLLVGIAKAGFGGGISVIATPLLALVVSPTMAAGLLLPVLCCCDVVAWWHYRREFDTHSLWQLLPGALFGVVLASLTLAWMPSPDQMESFLRIMIGTISLLFVVWQTTKKFWQFKAAHDGGRERFWGSLCGTIAGFASMLAHAGGPPVTIFLLPKQLPRQRFVGTTVYFFLILNFFKLIPYTMLGMLPQTNLLWSLALLPFVPVGVWLGLWCNRHLSQQRFERLIYVLLTLTAIDLLTGWNPIIIFSRIF